MFSAQNFIIPLFAQKDISKLLDRDSYFNMKSDNFLDLPTVYNMVYSSLTDEDPPDSTYPVGTL